MEDAACESQIIVNLSLAHTLLVAAEEQPYGFLKVRDVEFAHEVELMAAAGLVEASVGSGNNEAFAVINCVTEQGHVFLRAFKSQPPPRIENKQAFAFADVD